MNHHDHRDVLHVRMRDLTREFMHMLSPNSGLSREHRQDVLDRLVEHAGWCQHVIEEYCDR